VFTQQTPGCLSGLSGGLLFFWCHDSFFLFFPVTFSFFRHDVSPGNFWGIFNLLLTGPASRPEPQEFD
jgi:hypothetical protein